MRCKFYIVLFFSIPWAWTIAQNPVVIENSLTGNPISEWGVPDFRDARVNGFSTEVSINKGQTVNFKIHSQTAAPVTVSIYRLGYYNGNGARKIIDLGTIAGTSQPSGIVNSSTGLYDCSNWSISTQWAVPSTAVSGVYIAKLTRSGGGSNHIVFIVRDDTGNSDILFQMTDATWQAYNGYGGNYLYAGTTGFPNGRAVKVSYNRPVFPYNSGFSTDNRQSDWYMNAEYPMIRWVERNGYNVSYTSCVEVARQGSLLLSHKIFMSAGHDEYWSKEQRDNVEAARNAGVHCAFFTGNEVYWKTRWESDASGNAFHTLVCYKEGTLGDGTVGENACGYKCDPLPNVWTGLWRTGAGYDAGKPENGLTGQISWVETNGPIRVTSAYKSHRFWRNTAIAGMASGQFIDLAPNTLGYEWDYEQYFSNYPLGRMKLSLTSVNGKNHHLSLYRHASGALVFGAGTVQWSWGLDNQHYGGSNNIVSRDMQQATVNLFSDMGVQPGSIQTDLVPATQSADLTPPSTVITYPQSGTQFAPGSTINFTGTSSDAAMVSVVEISVDGGTNWIPLSGTTSWSYSWTPTQNGSYTILVRGWDDSGNKEITGNPPSTNAIFVNIGTVTTPPAILTHPQSQTVCEGTAVTFSSTVSQNPLPAVQWQVSSSAGAPWTNISGATSPNYTFTAQLSDNGKRYRAVWTNSAGSTVSNQAVLTVNVVPPAPTGPATVNFCYAAKVSDLSASGTSIKWYTAFTGGTELSSTTPLVNGNHYYASQTVNGCESISRLDVTVSVNVSTNTTFVLDGSRSTGTISNYLWTFVSGPNSPVIQNPASAVTTVSGAVNGTYVFDLSLNGGASKSRVLVNVNPINDSILVHAGFDRQVTLPTSSVNLDGNGSLGPVKSYTWSKISGPGNTTITNASAKSAQANGLLEGDYVFELLIRDNNDIAYRDSVNIRVNPSPLPETPVIAKSNAASGTRNTVVNTLSSIPAGSLLVLSLAQADDFNSGLNPSITSTPALTWTKRVASAASVSGNAAIWTAFLPGGGNITVTSKWGIEQMSCVLYALTDYDTSLSGSTASAASQSSPSVSLITNRPNSLIIGVTSDWRAIDGASRAYRGVPTESFYEFISGIYTAYHYRKIATGAISYTLGLSSPTGMSAGTALWEIPGIPAPPSSPASDAGSNQTLYLAVPPTGLPVQTFCGSAIIADLRVSGTGVRWYPASTSPDTLPLQQSLTNGNSYFASQLINGCETNLRLEVKAVIEIPQRDTIAVSICSRALPYSWRGKQIGISGIFTDTIKNYTSGCDTLHTLRLDVTQPVLDTTIKSICAEQAPFEWRGSIFNISGIFYDTVQGPEGGCDTIRMLDLTILPGVETPSIDSIRQCDGSYILSVSGGVGGYLWSNGDTLTSIRIFNSGIYSVIRTNSSGCFSVDTISLSDVSVTFNASFTEKQDVRCYGGSSGGFKIMVQGGVSPYMYSLDDNSYDTLKEFSGLPSGAYKIFVKDSLNCVTTSSVIVSQPANELSMNVTRDNVQVHGAETGTIYIFPSGGSGGYQFQLNDGPYIDSGYFSRLAAGNYLVSVKDTNNCKVARQIFIEQPADDLSCTENTWAGEISSSWEDPLNWTCGTVPTSNSNVSIPANTVFQPLISSHVVIKSLWMKSSSLLQIKDGYTLKMRSGATSQ